MISFKVSCNTKQIRQDLSKLRWSILCTCIVIWICNLFGQDKIKASIEARLASENSYTIYISTRVENK